MSADKTIKIEDVRLTLTCNSCKQTYGYSLQKPQVRKNCRCGKGTFYISVQGVGGKKANVRVHVEFEGKFGGRKKIEPKVQIES